MIHHHEWIRQLITSQFGLLYDFEIRLAIPLIVGIITKLLLKKHGVELNADRQLTKKRRSGKVELSRMKNSTNKQIVNKNKCMIHSCGLLTDRTRGKDTAGRGYEVRLSQVSTLDEHNLQ